MEARLGELEDGNVEITITFTREEFDIWLDTIEADEVDEQTFEENGEELDEGDLERAKKKRYCCKCAIGKTRFNVKATSKVEAVAKCAALCGPLKVGGVSSGKCKPRIKKK